MIAGLVVLSMPLLTLQSRMLTSEIGTACGRDADRLRLVALVAPRPAHGTALAAVDAAIAIAALAAGSVLGVLRRRRPARPRRAASARSRPPAAPRGAAPVTALVRRERMFEHVPAVIATLVATALVGLLTYQLYELKTPVPGIFPPAREVFGKAIVSDGCWSWALGGLWRPDDDLRNIFDSSFEQIAYGTFPWGVLAPIAIAGLVRAEDSSAARPERSRSRGPVGAWIAGEVFQRKVGFTLFAGFPALAIAVGVWIDSLHGSPARAARPDDDQGLPHGMILVGLFFVLAVLDPRQGHAVVRRSHHVAARRERLRSSTPRRRACCGSRPSCGS